MLERADWPSEEGLESGVRVKIKKSQVRDKAKDLKD